MTTEQQTAPPVEPAPPRETLVEIRDLVKYYPIHGGVLRRKLGDVKAVDGVSFEVLKGEGFAQPNPRPMFPNPPGLLRLVPHSLGLRDRIWWGAGSRATAQWAAAQGMNLMSSTLKNDESGRPFHLQQARHQAALPR